MCIDLPKKRYTAVGMGRFTTRGVGRKKGIALFFLVKTKKLSLLDKRPQGKACQNF